MRHSQHAAQHAHVAAAMAWLSALVTSSGGLATSVKDIIGILDSESPDLAEVVEQMGQLLGAAQQHESLTQASCANVSSVLNALVSVISPTADRADLRGQAEQLKDAVERLQDQVAALERKSDVDQHNILLGQLAFVIDMAAAKFVYGPGYRYYTSFRDLQVDMRLGSCMPEQRERWKQLCAFFQSKGLSPDDVTGLTSIVRRLRYETAHGSEAAMAATKLAQLRDWAQQVLEPQSLCDFEQLVDLATCFSSQEQPLVPAEYMVVQNRVRAALQQPHA